MLKMALRRQKRCQWSGRGRKGREGNGQGEGGDELREGEKAVEGDFGAGLERGRGVDGGVELVASRDELRATSSARATAAKRRKRTMKAPDQAIGAACCIVIAPLKTKNPVPKQLPPIATITNAAFASRRDLMVSEFLEGSEPEIREAATMPRMRATRRPMRASRETLASWAPCSSERLGVCNETTCWLSPRHRQ